MNEGKPAPRVNEINGPFWEGCNRGELILQQCHAPDCGRWVYFPRVCCPYCGSGDLAWKRASGRGKVASFTIVRRPQHPAFFPEAPYYFAAIRLDEGPLMYARLDGEPDPDAKLIGRAVEAFFVEHTAGQKLPFFRST